MTIDPTKRALTRVTCAQHITPHLRREIEALGFEIQHEDHVGVHTGATLHECLGLALRLRTAHHVMWHLARFRCPSPKALYTHASAFPWEELIGVDAYISVTSNVDNPKIDNSMYPNLVLKDAIVDRIKKRMGARPDSGADRTGVVVHLFWKGDRAWIYLNVNGRRLADRGYRKLPHHAPMRETLAAGVLMACGYDGTQIARQSHVRQRHARDRGRAAGHRPSTGAAPLRLRLPPQHARSRRGLATREA